MKLTRQKFAIYQKYRGDVDIWCRAANYTEREELTDADWSEMSSFFQQLQNLEKRQLSEEFAARVREKLHELAPDADFQKELTAYALTGV